MRTAASNTALQLYMPFLIQIAEKAMRILREAMMIWFFLFYFLLNLKLRVVMIMHGPITVLCAPWEEGSCDGCEHEKGVLSLSLLLSHLRICLWSRSQLIPMICRRRVWKIFLLEQPAQPLSSLRHVASPIYQSRPSVYLVPTNSRPQAENYSGLLLIQELTWRISI